MLQQVIYLFPFFLKDSWHLLNDLQKLNLMKKCKSVTLDADSFSTNINIKHAIKILETWFELHKDKLPPGCTVQPVLLGIRHFNRWKCEDTCPLQRRAFWICKTQKSKGLLGHGEISTNQTPFDIIRDSAMGTFDGTILGWRNYTSRIYLIFILLEKILTSKFPYSSYPWSRTTHLFLNLGKYCCKKGYR